MNQNEALLKINEIHNVIEGSNKAIFSGERMMLIGAMLTLIPAIEVLTQGLTFGADFGPQAGVIITAVHTVFYWVLFTLAGKLSPFKRKDHAEAHPLIKKAFSLRTPFVICIFGVIFAFAAIHQFQYIHPLVFVFLGLMFSLCGKFTIPAVSYIAYSYIGLGFVYIYLTQFQIPNLWIYMLVYNGLSYIAMGLFLRKEQAARV